MARTARFQNFTLTLVALLKVLAGTCMLPEIGDLCNLLHFDYVDMMCTAEPKVDLHGLQVYDRVLSFP